jgi:hypothetical protein
MSSVSLSSFIKTSSYWSKLVGIRWQLVLSILGIWLVSLWLRSEYGQDDSNLWLVMNQFMRVVEVTILGLFILSLLAAMLVWFYFIQSIKSKAIILHTKFGDGQKAEAGWVPLTVIINGSVFRPLLGTIQARLIFTDKRISDIIILDANIPKPRHWWRQGIKGRGQTLLHDRGIYDVDKILVLFTDMFGLVSLPYSVPFTQQLFTLPRMQEQKHVKATPNSTEEQLQRIDIPKRVEGEHVNYKEFEAGDNIQRIVWKIYAKSGQLVVRIPETKDPYTSHLYFYASFYHGLTMQGGVFETELLNIYKDRVRNLFEALQLNGYDVKIPQDQEVPKLSGLNEKKNELFQITAANWQNGTKPTAFIKADKAAFVCLSSLSPVAEVESIIKTLPLSTPLVVVKLSDAISSPFQISVKDIFFRPAKQPTDALRKPWIISSLRRDLIKNEKAIEKTLRQRANSWLTSTIELGK